MGNSIGRGTAGQIAPLPDATWHVRPFRESDLPGLLHLYHLVFGRERTEADFRWKLLGRARPEQFPSPKSKVQSPDLAPEVGNLDSELTARNLDTVWVAADGETIVGQHAGIPSRLKLGNSVLSVMHAVEAMTHPDYRKQGMLTALGGGLYEHWRAGGVPLIMGLPHAGWGTRAHALGYREAFPLTWLSRPIRPVSMLLARLGRGSRASAGDGPGMVWPLHRGKLLILPCSERADEVDAIWDHASDAFRAALVRDSGWVRWRYLEAPERLYTVLVAWRGERPVGYIAYAVAPIERRQIGRIADLFTRPDEKEVASGLLGAAIQDLWSKGADSAAMLIGTGTPLYRAVRSSGFLLNRGSYEVSFIPLAPELDMSVLNGPTGWHLMGGDFDVV